MVQALPSVVRALLLGSLLLAPTCAWAQRVRFPSAVLVAQAEEDADDLVPVDPEQITPFDPYTETPTWESTLPEPPLESPPHFLSPQPATTWQGWLPFSFCPFPLWCPGEVGSGPAGTWEASAEALLLRYHKTDGVRAGTGLDKGVKFDFEFSPRLTVAYVTPCGLGLRLRWWDYEHKNNAIDSSSSLEIDTYTCDIELFEQVCIGNWFVEISGGVRYNDWRESMIDDTNVWETVFCGTGGVIGVEVTRPIPIGALYMRGRGAIMMDDREVYNPPAIQHQPRTDSVQGITEIAFGYECQRRLSNGMLIFGRLGFELQNWFNYSAHFDSPPPAEQILTGQSDVGFGGFGLLVGLGL